MLAVFFYPTPSPVWPSFHPFSFETLDCCLEPAGDFFRVHHIHALIATALHL
jgi:hypothetical protein